jgi:hypothetical protein
MKDDIFDKSWWKISGPAEFDPNKYKGSFPRTSPADLRRKEQHIRDTYDRDPRASEIIEESLREGVIGQIPPARILPLEIRRSIFSNTLKEINNLPEQKL